MNIVSLQKENIGELKRLYLEEFFDRDNGKLELFLANYTDAASCLTGLIGGEIVSTLQMKAVDMMSCGGFVPAIAFHSVITRCDCRGKGYAGELLRDALIRTHDEGCSFLWLDSSRDRYGFYRQYGWGNVSRKKTVKIHAKNVPSFLGGFEFRDSPFDSFSDLNGLYEFHMNSYRGWPKRDTSIWTNRLAWGSAFGQRIIRAESPDGVLRGFAQYAPGENGAVAVNDFHYDSHRTKIALCSWFAARFPSLQFYDLPFDDSLEMEFLDAALVDVSFGPMIRLVDVIGSLCCHFRDTLPDGEISFRVYDPICDWNNGVFRVEVKNGKTDVARIGNDAADLELSIDALSEILFLKESGNILDSGRVRCRDETAFGRFFDLFDHRKICFMCDII